MTHRVLVACVGNVLRGDDGFGVAVARMLEAQGVPSHVDVLETGIGGMSVVHQLMEGYAGLVIVDAVERGATPGTLFVLEPPRGEEELGPMAWQALFANLHLAEPSRILLMAEKLKVLPRHVRVVGCQPLSCEELSEVLSPPVQAAVSETPALVWKVTEEISEMGATMPLNNGDKP